MRYRDLRGVLASSVAIMAVAIATPAMAQIRSFDIPAQSAATGIPALAKQADIQLLVSAGAVTGKKIRAIRGQMTVDEAIRRAVSDADLQIINSDGRTYTLAPRNRKRPTSALEAPTAQAAQSQTAPQYDEIIVTAQKKEERIQDVPIAMTALSAKALDEYKIEGGSELLRAIPNVNFSKSNFSMYNFSIRGIGTKAISASSDPAVAINFNNTPLIRNRLFEAEFFDMERIEVLRGPQGTLYGRNATGGVVNLIPAQPTADFAGEVKGEIGSYETRRLSGMLNVPLADTLGLRVSGAWTKRDGFDYNTFTQKRTNGRDLYSTRAILRWEPSDRLSVNAIWQHFEEDDDRLRTGKQLCTRDPGPDRVGNVAVTDPWLRGGMSQGCLPKSLYDDAAYGAPNAYSYAFLYVGGNIAWGRLPGPAGGTRPGPIVASTDGTDPYEGIVQSKNLREISSGYDPIFRANNDFFQLNLDFNVTDNVKIISQTGYASDKFYSTQDYNRYNPLKPMFNDSRGLVNSRNVPFDPPGEPGKFPGATPNGIFCDPQLGCRDRMIGADLMTSDNRQWTQELRVQSDFSSNFNFNIGLNYIDFKTQDNYYVFNNMFTLIADWYYSANFAQPTTRPCELGFEGRECIYIDPNPISNLNNMGHNYFLSQNGVRTKSTGIFGEIYYDISKDVKLTLGARYTSDDKLSSQVPTELLLGGGNKVFLPDGTAVEPGGVTGGTTNSGYNPLPSIQQNWNAFSGRAVVDWRPTLSFTNDTLIYFSASRGYKGGGTNPPRVNFNPKVVQYLDLAKEFEPEYLTALEIGTKNTFPNGVTLNANAFFYDYKNYQISQITERIAFNENFDAISWGLELEAAWRPSRHFKLDSNIGYLRTRIKNGEQSIDVLNRTQGNPEWMVLRPWLQVPSNCVAPTALVEKILGSFLPDRSFLSALCPGAQRLGTFDAAGLAADGIQGVRDLSLIYGFTYNPLRPYDPETVGLNIANGGSGAPNGGRGFYAPLGGNELPNSPRVTFNIGAEYSLFMDNDRWKATFRADYYRQSKSFARVYNTEIDRLKAWDNVNLSFYLESLEDDLTFNIYVKNLFDKAPITDAFFNSDDIGMPANVFTLDPRIIGFSVKKNF
ncbi:TonB-dependent receptor domain-containing protein [Sphingopyxis yananensis]|uniref:TonB-dependent receptor domain-containing protein n=1 Tax=Sphingopyxis yananensis TaxID=2886687 RepID=UPI001D1095DA|nr:TonB-dependent receptor [Sphingopyxis yananensis]MCC2601641.1 TonB-dependent receptor [Sphingopyxis yananensis]